LSYLVLARKWRPQTFRDLIGQEHVSQTLKNAIDSGRVAHAFLFTGARGVGKTSSARILAKALNCEQGPTPEPCNVCTACLEITAGNAVDVFEIDGASNTGVDDIRELRETVKYLPSRCRYKIFIIDEVHMLSTNAFNALLKTLEEPPPHVKFIFATTEPHKVPITILSRCQRYDFKRIPLQKIVGRLRYIVDQEQITISEGALAIIARKGDGSMRDSLSTLDQVLAFCGETVRDEEVATLLGVVDRRLLVETGQAVFARDCSALLELVKRVDMVGYSMRQFAQELIELFRTLTIIRAVPEPAELLDLAEAELAELRVLAAAGELAELQRHLTLLLKAETEMAHATFPRLILEMALLKMATLVPIVPVNELLRRLAALESGSPAASAVPLSQQKPRPESRPAQAAPVAAPKVIEKETEKSSLPSSAAEQVQGGAGDWSGFVTLVKGKKAGIGSLLEHGRPLEVSPQRLAIGFPAGSFYLNSLKDPEALATLKALAASYFQAPTAVELVPLMAGSNDAPPTLEEKKSHERSSRVAKLQGEVREDPLVTAALEIFGGEISEIKELDR
jgi:DNA polymerase-3 subunit gamma/tau